MYKMHGKNRLVLAEVQFLPTAVSSVLYVGWHFVTVERVFFDIVFLKSQQVGHVHLQKRISDTGTRVDRGRHIFNNENGNLFTTKCKTQEKILYYGRFFLIREAGICYITE